jgi:DNA-binding GntR family transcriptional regulator
MTVFDIAVNRSSPVPIYHQEVAHGFKLLIETGALKPGTKLDNEIDIAAALKISRPTVRQAMNELVRAGLLVRKRGVGTQVVSSKVRRDLDLSSLFDDLVQAGQAPASRVLSFELCHATPSVAKALHLPDGAKVFHFTRLRLVDGRPLALMENWVRDDITDLSAEELGDVGLYQLLRAKGINFRRATQCVGAAVAGTDQSSLLQVAPGSPLVTMERTAMDDNGKVIEVGSHYYRADSYTFEMTLVQR